MSTVDILLLPTLEFEGTATDSAGTLLEPTNKRKTPRSFAAHVYELAGPEKSETGITTKPKKRTKLLSTPIARFIARSIDLSWQWGLAILAVFILLSQTMTTPSSAPHYVVVLLISFPLAFLLDTLALAILGNTPGKLLFGIKAVTWRGANLNLQTAFKRNFLCWRSAFACGILPLAIYTLYKQFRLVGKGERTTYDKNQHLRIQYEPYPVAVQALILAGLIAIPFTSAFGQYIAPTIKKFNPMGAVSSFDLSRIRLKQEDGVGMEIQVTKPAEFLKRTEADAMKTAYVASVPESQPVTLISKAELQPVLFKTNVGTNQNNTNWINPFSGFSTFIDAGWLGEPPIKTETGFVMHNPERGERITLERFDNTSETLSAAAEIAQLKHRTIVSYPNAGTKIQRYSKEIWENTGTPVKGKYKNVLVQFHIADQHLYRLLLETTSAAQATDQESGKIIATIWNTIE